MNMRKKGVLGKQRRRGTIMGAFHTRPLPDLIGIVPTRRAATALPAQPSRAFRAAVRNPGLCDFGARRTPSSIHGSGCNQLKARAPPHTMSHREQR